MATLVLGAREVRGQVPATPPPFSASSSTPIYQGDQVPTEGGFGSLPGLPNLMPDSPLHWYPFQFYPHFDYSAVYGNGLLSEPGSPVKSWIQTISPGILVRWRDHWTLDYTPSYHIYSDPTFHNGWDHAVSLSGSASTEKWTFHFSQGYGNTDEPLIETGTQTHQRSFNTFFGADYELSDRLKLQLGANQIIDLVDAKDSSLTNKVPLSSSYTWSASQSLQYLFMPQLSGSIGLSEGYSSVETGSDQINEQLNATVNWSPAPKLSLAVTAGVENRQFLDSEVPSSLTPLFSASLHYQIFEHTTASLNASRNVEPSLLSGQTTTSTGVSAGLNQRFFGKYNLALSVGYASSAYESTTVNTGTLRTDDTTTFSAHLSRSIFKRGSIGAVYSYSHNSSTDGGFDYNSQQVGVTLSYHY